MSPSKAIFLRDRMHIMSSYPHACEICGETLNEDNSFQNTHAPVRLEACRHVFGMRCIVDWTNSTPQTNHNKCPICNKRLFVKEHSSSSTDRSSRSQRSSRHENAESSTSRNAYRGNPAYAARAETVSDSASTVRPSRRSSRRDNAASSGLRNAPQVDPRPVNTSRHDDNIPSRPHNVPQVDPRSMNSSRRENDLPTRSRNTPQADHRASNAPHPNPRRADAPPSRSRTVPQGNPGYPFVAPPTTVWTADPSTRYITFVDARRNPNLILSRSQGPPPPLDERERRRASWNKHSGSSKADTWTS